MTEILLERVSIKGGIGYEPTLRIQRASLFAQKLYTKKSKQWSLVKALRCHHVNAQSAASWRNYQRALPFDPLDLSVAEASKSLGVSRKTLSAVLNGRAGISPEMAIRLSITFNTLAESWLMQQTQYDLWHAEQHSNELHVKKLVAA